MTTNSSGIVITVSGHLLSIRFIALSHKRQCVGVEVVD
jgi:hypothetical protein